MRNRLFRQSMPRLLIVVVLLTPGVSAAPVAEELIDGNSDRTEGLKPFNSLIGEWRGVGQLKRGSRKGAWAEKAVCEWQFADGETSVVLKSADSKQFEQLRLTWDQTSQQLVLRRKTKDGVQVYRGPAPKDWPGTVRLVTGQNDDGSAYGCTISQFVDVRATLLFEKQTSPTGSFRRVFGIGYTRAGEKLAQSGAGQRKCIVTGGLGKIPVSYQGKTYYVCCQGCVQAFNADPKAIIADYRDSLSKP